MWSQYKALAIVLNAYGTPIRSIMNKKKSFSTTWKNNEKNDIKKEKK